ncbi:MAG: Rne/Rng family ribonuclease [Proteobacteria bacterium]|nr:Rne/Rng family ribonuclease [Pseudomonadota bacterium]
MSKQILVNSNHYETRVALLEDGEIKQLHIEREEDKNVVGNVYLGVVKRVLPGMQAAFLELGLERTAFLYVDDIIDEPFGSDVDVLDEEESEESDERYSESESREPSEGSATDSESAGEESEALVIEEDTTNAPIFVAPSLTSPEGQEEEEESADEDGGEDGEEEFEEPLSIPDNEPDFELTDVETESPEPEPIAAKAPEAPIETSAAGPAPAFEPMPEEIRQKELLTDQVTEEDEGPQPGNEKPASERSDFQRDRYHQGRRRDSREPRRGRGNYRGSREGRDQDRNESRRHAQGDSRDFRDRDTRSRDNRDNRDTRDNRDRNRDNREGGRGPRRGRYEAREGRSARQRPRYGNRNNRRRGFSRRRRSSANIQDLLKEGQEILVQVAKAPIGTKGARLTTHISLPGRNLVLMPTVKHLGISRRIESDRERRRLRDIFTKRLRVKGVGFIIRTVAEGKTFRELKADADYLIRTWQQIKRDSSQKRAPALIHEDLSLTYRTVRDYFTEDVDSLVIDNPSDHDGIQDFIGQFMPQLKSRVKLFKGPSQLFEHYGIEAEISRALSKKVWLKSGGYLLIDQSEALTAIDVNTGRYVGSKSLEETILRTNLEAVKEIAYQLRIRNVGGIIIIDLIDMESSSNREKVFNALQDALSGDKSKTNILKISELGLVEMTRKRTHEDLIRYLTESCPHCDGRGYTKSRRTVAFEIFREIEKEAISQTQNIVVFAAPGVVSLLAKEESRHVGLLEKRFGKTILIKPDNSFHTEQFEVFGKH